MVTLKLIPVGQKAKAQCKTVMVTQRVLYFPLILRDDRRFVMGSGRVDLRIFPNDTQSIIVAQLVARGSSNLNSVTRLKSLSRTAQIIFDSNFDVIPKPPVPYVYQSVTPVNQTTCNLNVYWNDAAESFITGIRFFIRKVIQIFTNLKVTKFMR